MGGQETVTGKEALIGSRAIVKSISNGNVTVSVNSQLWSAIVVGGPSINVGDEVIVLGVDGLKLRVARLDRQQIIAPPLMRRIGQSLCTAPPRETVSWHP